MTTSKAEHEKIADDIAVIHKKAKELHSKLHAKFDTQQRGPERKARQLISVLIGLSLSLKESYLREPPPDIETPYKALTNGKETPTEKPTS